MFAQSSIFGCTKTDGKRNRTAQGNDGCGNQSVRKRTGKVTKSLLMEFLVSVDSFREVKNVRTNQETITVLWRLAVFMLYVFSVN